MPRGKKKVEKKAASSNGNGHQSISYKVGKREGGSIKFSGIVGDPPKDLDKTLNKFGFGRGQGFEWRDETCPTGDDVYVELDRLASIAEVKISSCPPPTKRGGATYTVSIGGADEVKGKTLTDALIKAHRAWNREGRKIGSTPLETAVITAIAK